MATVGGGVTVGYGGGSGQPWQSRRKYERKGK